APPPAGLRAARFAPGGGDRFRCQRLLPSQGPNWAREERRAEPRRHGRAGCRGSPGEPRLGHWNSHPAGGAGAHPGEHGSNQKKALTWKTGFWGEKAGGWHYDLMLMAMSMVILFTAGGRLVLRF